MDILTVVKTIFRRWLVVVPIILITAAIAYSVGSSIKPEYAISGTVLLAAESGAVSVGNDSVAVVTAPVLAELLRSLAVNKRMADAGAAAPYTIDVDPITSILRVTASGRDGPANIRTAEVVLDNLDEELRRLEITANVPEGNRALVRLLSRPNDQPGGGLPSASGSAFLVPAGIAPPNQYAATNYTARILTELMLAAESRAKVAERAGGVAKFTLTAQQRDTAPILSINARGLDRRLTEATFDAVVATADQLLVERQTAAGIEPKSRTRLFALNSPGGAAETSGTVVKSVATVVGLGLIAAATTAILTESLMAGRASRRRRDRDRSAPLGESEAFEPRADIDGPDVYLSPGTEALGADGVASGRNGLGGDRTSRADKGAVPNGNGSLDEVDPTVVSTGEDDVEVGEPTVVPTLAERRRRRSPLNIELPEPYGEALDDSGPARPPIDPGAAVGGRRRRRPQQGS